MSKETINNMRPDHDKIKLRIPKGEKEKLLQYAGEHGYTLNALICDAIAQYRHTLDGAVKEPMSEIYLSDGIISDRIHPNLYNQYGYTVVSLYPGMGSMCLAFAHEGYNVLKAYEEDHAACKLFRDSFTSGRLSEGDLSRIDLETVPRADVLISGFPSITVPEGADHFDAFNHYETVVTNIVNVLERVRPSFFYLEPDNTEPFDYINKKDHTAAEDMKEYLYTLLKERLTDLHFSLTERSFQALDWTPLPLSGRKRYLIAVSEDFGPNTVFDEPIPVYKSKPAVKLIYNHNKLDSFFYYRRDLEFDRSVIASVKSRNNLYLVRDGKVYDCPGGMCPALTDTMINKRNTVALMDDFGGRQLTPCEFLMFKGFHAGFRFSQELLLEDRYRLAGGSATVPVTRAIAQRIKSCIRNKKLQVNSASLKGDLTDGNC